MISSSNPPRAGTDWRALLLFLYSLLSMGFMLILAAISGLSALVNMLRAPDPQNVTALVLAGGLILGAALLAPGLYYSGRRVFGLTDAPGVTFKFTAADWLLFLFGWPLTLLMSQVLLQQQYGWIVAPIFTSLSVLLPIWFLIKLGAHGLPQGSRLRSWGALSAGISFTPVLILIVEAVIVIGLLILVGIYVGLQPDMLNTLQRFAAQMESARSEEQAIELLLPYATSPLTLIGLLAVFSVIAPIVEETLKTILLWFVGRRTQGPAEGFVLGLLCGAGFTLIETLGSSSSGVDAWSATMLTRFGSDLIHIVNGGLMGWAIVSALQQKRYGRLFATFIAVMLLHSLWNACTVFISLGALYLQIPGAPTWALNAIAGGAGGLLTLAIGNMAVLILSNRRLRTSPPPPTDSDSPEPLAVIESSSP